MFIIFILSYFIFYTFQRKLEELSCGEKSVNISPLVSRATLDTMLRCTLSYEDEEIQDAKG